MEQATEVDTVVVMLDEPGLLAPLTEDDDEDVNEEDEAGVTVGWRLASALEGEGSSSSWMDVVEVEVVVVVVEEEQKISTAAVLMEEMPTALTAAELDKDAEGG